MTHTLGCLAGGREVVSDGSSPLVSSNDDSSLTSLGLGDQFRVENRSLMSAENRSLVDLNHIAEFTIGSFRETLVAR